MAFPQSLVAGSRPERASHQSYFPLSTFSASIEGIPKGIGDGKTPSFTGKG